MRYSRNPRFRRYETVALQESVPVVVTRTVAVCWKPSDVRTRVLAFWTRQVTFGTIGLRNRPSSDRPIRCPRMFMNAKSSVTALPPRSERRMLPFECRSPGCGRTSWCTKTHVTTISAAPVVVVPSVSEASARAPHAVSGCALSPASTRRSVRDVHIDLQGGLQLRP